SRARTRIGRCTRPAPGSRSALTRPSRQWTRCPTFATRCSRSGARDDARELAALRVFRDAVLRGWRADEALDTAAALEALTVTPAWLEGAEDRRGQLKPGMLAGLLVLDRDPFHATRGATA